jgi:hypothetical protein
MSTLQSIVIIRASKGYIAYLRFDNKHADIDMAFYSKFQLYSAIERYVRKNARNYR